MQFDLRHEITKQRKSHVWTCLMNNSIVQLIASVYSFRDSCYISANRRRLLRTWIMILSVLSVVNLGQSGLQEMTKLFISLTHSFPSSRKTTPFSAASQRSSHLMQALWSIRGLVEGCEIPCVIWSKSLRQQFYELRTLIQAVRNQPIVAKRTRKYLIKLLFEEIGGGENQFCRVLSYFDHCVLKYVSARL